VRTRQAFSALDPADSANASWQKFLASQKRMLYRDVDRNVLQCVLQCVAVCESEERALYFDVLQYGVRRESCPDMFYLNVCSISMYVLSQCDAVKRKSSLFRCVAVWSQEKELSRQVLSQCVFYLNLRAISMCCSQKKELTSCAVCSPKKKLSRHVLSQCVAARRNSFLFRYVAKELEERAVSTCSI